MVGQLFHLPVGRKITRRPLSDLLEQILWCSRSNYRRWVVFGASQLQHIQDFLANQRIFNQKAIHFEKIRATHFYRRKISSMVHEYPLAWFHPKLLPRWGVSVGQLSRNILTLDFYSFISPLNRTKTLTRLNIHIPNHLLSVPSTVSIASRSFL